MGVKSIGDQNNVKCSELGPEGVTLVKLATLGGWGGGRIFLNKTLTFGVGQGIMQLANRSNKPTAGNNHDSRAAQTHLFHRHRP